MWLECDTVLKWGGGRKGEERKNCREYVETAVREGLRPPVSHLIFVLLKEEGAFESGLCGKGVDGGGERNRIQIMGRPLRIERAGDWHQMI